MDDVVSSLHHTIHRLHCSMRGRELIAAIRIAAERHGLTFTSDELTRLALPANRETVNTLVEAALNRPSRKAPVGINFQTGGAQPQAVADAAPVPATPDAAMETAQVEVEAEDPNQNPAA